MGLNTGLLRYCCGAQHCPPMSSSGRDKIKTCGGGAGAANLRRPIVDDDTTWPLTRIDLAKGRPGAIPRRVFWCLKFVERRRVAAGASSGGRMTAGIGRPPRFVIGDDRRTRPWLFA